MGREKQQFVFEHAQNAQILIHATHAQMRIRAFALHCYILWCPLILLADSKDPDQTARMRRLILAFAVRMCPKKHFRMAKKKSKKKKYPFGKSYNWL